jgi:hypothetical protein
MNFRRESLRTSSSNTIVENVVVAVPLQDGCYAMGGHSGALACLPATITPAQHRLQAADSAAKGFPSP